MAKGKDVTYKISFEADLAEVEKAFKEMRESAKKTDFKIPPEDINNMVKQIQYLKGKIKEGLEGTELSLDMDENEFSKIMQEVGNLDGSFKSMSDTMRHISAAYNKSFDSEEFDQHIKKVKNAVGEYKDFKNQVEALRDKMKGVPKDAPNLLKMDESQKDLKTFQKSISKMREHTNKELSSISGRTVVGFGKQIDKAKLSVDKLAASNFISDEQYTKAVAQFNKIETEVEEIFKDGYSEKGFAEFKKLQDKLNTLSFKNIENLDLSEVTKNFKELGGTAEELKEVEALLGQSKQQLIELGIISEDGVIDLDKAEKQIKAVVAEQKRQKKAQEETNEEMYESSKVAENAYGKIKKEVVGAANEVNRHKNNVKDIENAYEVLGKKVSYIFGVQIFNMVRQGLTRVVREATNSIMDLDEALTEIATVTGRTRESMWSNFKELNDMAKELGVTTQGVVEASVLFYRQGKSTAEVMDMVKASTISAGIASIETAIASDRLTAALNGFRLEASEAMNVADKFAALAANSASDFDELSLALTKNAAASYTAGVDMDHMLGYLAKVIETTREAPTSVGTAFKTIIARAQQLKEIGEVIDEETGESFSLNRVDKALQEVGVRLTDSSGQLRDLQDVLDELGSKWDGLNRNQRAYIATMMAGTRMQSRFFALMNDYDRTLELVQTSQTSVNAATEQFNTHIQGLEAAANKLKATLEELYASMADTGTIQSVLSLFTKLAEAAIVLEENIGVLNTVMMLLSMKGAAMLLKTFTMLPYTLGSTIPGMAMVMQKLETMFVGLGVTSATTVSMILPLVAAVGVLVGVIAYAARAHKKQKEEAHATRIELLNLNETLEDSIAKYEKYENEISKTADNNEKMISTTNQLIKEYKELNTSMERRAAIAQQLASIVDLDSQFHFGTDLTLQQMEQNVEFMEKAVELEKKRNLEKLKAQTLEKEKFLSDDIDEDVEKLDKSIKLYEDLINARNKINTDGLFDFSDEGQAEDFEKKLTKKINEIQLKIDNNMYTGVPVSLDDREALNDMKELKDHLKKMTTDAEKITFLSELDSNYSKTNAQAQQLAETIEEIKNNIGEISFDRVVGNLMETENLEALDALEKIYAFSPDSFDAINTANKKLAEDKITELSEFIAKYAKDNEISLKDMFEDPEQMELASEEFFTTQIEILQEQLNNAEGFRAKDAALYNLNFMEEMYNMFLEDKDRLEKDLAAQATVELQLSLEGSFEDTIDSRESYIESTKRLIEAEEKMADGMGLTGEELKTLIKDYPELEEEVYLTAEGYMFEEEAINKVRKAKEKEFEESLRMTSLDLAKQYNKFAELNNLNKMEINNQMSLIAIKESAIALYDEEMTKIRELEEELKGPITMQRMRLIEQQIIAEKEGLSNLDDFIASVNKKIEIVNTGINWDAIAGGGSTSSTEKAKDALTDYFYILEEIAAKQREIDFLQKNEPDNIYGMIRALREKQNLMHKLNEARRKDLALIEKQLETDSNNIELLEKQADLKEAIHATSIEWHAVEESITGILKEQLAVYDERIAAMEKEYQEKVDSVKSTEDYIIEIIKKRLETEKKLKEEAWQDEQDELDKIHEDRIDKYDKELDAFTEMVEGKKKAYQDQWAEEDYAEDVSAQQREILDIQQQINRLSLRDDAEARSKVIELEEELREKQKDLGDFQRDYERDSIIDNLDEQEGIMQDYIDDKISLEEARYEAEKEIRDTELEEWIEAFDKRYDNAKIYSMAHDALMDNEIQMYKDGRLEVMNLEKAFEHYENTFGKGMSLMGDQIKIELIENLKIAQEEMHNLNQLADQIEGMKANRPTIEESKDATNIFQNPQDLIKLANIKWSWDKENSLENSDQELLDALHDMADAIREEYNIKNDNWSFTNLAKILNDLGFKDYKPERVVPSYDIGSSYLKKTGTVMAHEGEAIIPKDFNPFDKQGFVNLLKQLQGEDKKNFINDYLININVDGVLDATVIPNLTNRIEDVIERVERSKINEKRRKQIL